MTRWKLGAVVVFVLASLGPVPALAQESSEWRSYGADTWSTKYAPLDQIDASNVARLRIAWRWSSPENAIAAENKKYRPGWYEPTPLKIGDVLYTSSSLGHVAAIDPGSGETLWLYDSKSRESGRPNNVGFISRGVSYWTDGEREHILLGTGDAHLIALDAATGRPVAGFGEGGRVDLTEGLRRKVNRRYYSITSPPLVCGDVAIVGASVADLAIRRYAPPGDVRGFDVRTGEQLWTFHSIPQEGELGNDTWEDGSWEHTGNTNVWSMMSCDEEIGYAYLPFGTPTSDYYGGHRHGDNLFAESLVAVEAKTGKRVWHFQGVHHGIWDYDFPAAPNLVDITVDGRNIKAVAQVSKQGFTYVFDRVTGEPVWPIEERPVPPSTVPGEKLSETQPFPTKPPPFERQGVRKEDLIDFTPELRAEAEKVLSSFNYGPIFVPFELERPTVYLPGWTGGANWTGAAVDPETGILYVPSITSPIAFRLLETDPARSHFRYAAEPSEVALADGVPLFKPPYGRVTAIDLNTGEHVWMQPLGSGPSDHPRLRDLDLPRLGWPHRGAPLVTRTLLFVSQEGPYGNFRFSEDQHALEVDTFIVEPRLRAFDKATGELVAEIDLPANGIAAPMTYLHRGRQYVAVSIGGNDFPSELVALALP
ncbi:MAG: pyrroloquinoline quinone-dependent dehydrogenase [Thermoanaerobaculia bacterium]|nr:pyrroloquinoline quinone-dependent dehydrogenase [Thermoanaerobaculia bacterium]